MALHASAERGEHEVVAVVGAHFAASGQPQLELCDKRFEELFVRLRKLEGRQDKVEGRLQKFMEWTRKSTFCMKRYLWILSFLVVVAIALPLVLHFVISSK